MQRIKKYIILQDEYILQYASYIIILVAIVQHALNRPVGVSQREQSIALLLLGLLMALNIAWQDMYKYFKDEALADWVFIALSSALIVGAFAIGRVQLFAYLLFMLQAQTFTTKPFLPALLVTLILFAGFYVTLVVDEGYALVQALEDTASGLVFGSVFVMVVSLVVRYAFEQRARAENLLEELQAAQARERELAAAAERVRLAREIHDGLGHYLTVLNVQLQAAQKLITRDVDKAAEVVDICRKQAQDALREVRRSVAVMRQSPLDGKSLDEALTQLVGEFDAHSPLNARLTVEGTSRDLSQVTALTLYRVVQEGLTNAQKHATGAKEVHIRLNYTSDSVSVQVRDDGHASPPDAPKPTHSGFGLAGLHERAEQLRGRFRSSTDDEGGYFIEMSLPTGETP